MIALAALAVVPAQSSEPIIIQARNEIVLYPPLEEQSLPKLPIAQDKPKNIGGTGRTLSFFDGSAKLPEWKISPPVWPIKINQYFSRYHTGLDLDCQYREPIYAVQDGIITQVSYGWSGGYGNMVLIQHNGGFQTLYGHFNQIFVQIGANVSKGQTIGSCGSTGRSTGNHLHFETIYNNEWLNPLKYLK